MYKLSSWPRPGPPTFFCPARQRWRGVSRFHAVGPIALPEGAELGTAQLQLDWAGSLFSPRPSPCPWAPGERPSLLVPVPAGAIPLGDHDRSCSSSVGGRPARHRITILSCSVEGAGSSRARPPPDPSCASVLLVFGKLLGPEGKLLCHLQPTPRLFLFISKLKVMCCPLCHLSWVVSCVSPGWCRLSPWAPLFKCVIFGKSP